MVRANIYIAIFHMTEPALNTLHIVTYLIINMFNQELVTIFISILQMSKLRLGSHC